MARYRRFCRLSSTKDQIGQIEESEETTHFLYGIRRPRTGTRSKGFDFLFSLRELIF
jgi:hypothetical protein